MKKILGLAVAVAFVLTTSVVLAETANVNVKEKNTATKVQETVKANAKTDSEKDKVTVKLEEKTTATGKIKEEVKVVAKTTIDPTAECMKKPELVGKAKNDPAVLKCVADMKTQAQSDMKAAADKVNAELKGNETAKADTAATTATTKATKTPTTTTK